MNIYNVKPAEVDIYAMAGNSIDLDFEIEIPAGDDPLTECDLYMKIIKSDGTLLRELKSTGEDPELIAVDNGFSIKTNPITEVATFWYDLLKKSSSNIKRTIMLGKFIISKAQTIITE